MENEPLFGHNRSTTIADRLPRLKERIEHIDKALIAERTADTPLISRIYSLQDQRQESRDQLTRYLEWNQ